MNYRHIYHAGNFADIVKHLVLIAIIEQLKNKEKPFAVLDAFAGIGLYDLTSEAATKTLESHNGIGKLLQNTSSDPKLQHISEISRQDEFQCEPAECTKVHEHRRIMQNSLVSSFMKHAVPTALLASKLHNNL